MFIMLAMDFRAWLRNTSAIIHPGFLAQMSLPRARVAALTAEAEKRKAAEQARG
jgi:hypothetical protein